MVRMHAAVMFADYARGEEGAGVSAHRRINLGNEKGSTPMKPTLSIAASSMILFFI